MGIYGTSPVPRVGLQPNSLYMNYASSPTHIIPTNRAPHGDMDASCHHGNVCDVPPHHYLLTCPG